jgi:hypothetical protein
MTRCNEFYQKWEELPNFCKKAERTAKQIEEYLNIVDEFEKRGIKRDWAFAQFSEGASRPLHGVEEPVRSKILDLIAIAIQKGDKISSNDVRTWISIIEGKPSGKELIPAASPSPTPPDAVPTIASQSMTLPESKPISPSTKVAETSSGRIEGPEPKVPEVPAPESYPVINNAENSGEGTPVLMNVGKEWISFKVEIAREELHILLRRVDIGNIPNVAAAAQEAFELGLIELDKKCR